MKRSIWLFGPVWVWGVLVVGGSGCTPQTIERVSIPNQTLGAMVIAVAPALNFSGGNDFDPSSVADLMAGELSYLEGVNVIPVSRVLAVLARQGRQEIGSPAHALEVVQDLGADAILVFAVTEYDPYDPPIVGIAAQLYGFRRADSLGSLDPILVGRQAKPFALSPRVPATTPLSQAERVFDAAHQYVVNEVKAYAACRQEGMEPMRWKKYLASQRHYLRFCCHAIIEQLASSCDCTEVAVKTFR
ncbi:MAG: hypothetical protein KAV82_00805 [Phycisphaerae bacterium]|nr:hypothetical protein [Phycisphaerae bacterium]